MFNLDIPRKSGKIIGVVNEVNIDIILGIIFIGIIFGLIIEKFL